MMSDSDDDHQGIGTKTAYLVRERSDQMHPHEFVGIFVVEDLDELIDLVDECCDAEICEYRILPSGSVIAPGRSNTVPWPTRELDQENFQAMAGVTVSELWEPFFFEPDCPDQWRSLEPSAGNG